MPDIDPDPIVAAAQIAQGLPLSVPDVLGVMRRMLTSTAPAVLDAMQEALVRAGRLTEDVEWEEDLDGFGVTIRLQERRRHVTAWSDWKDADDA